MEVKLQDADELTFYPPSPAQSRRITERQSRFDLTRVRWIRRLIESRWPLFLARAVTLAGFVFTILAGLFGSPVGSHNFAIIFVWLAWWTALKLLFIPLGGRSWCSVCPLPMPGEWLQRGGLVSRSERRLGLGMRWPKALRGYWLQAGLFLTIGIFSAVTLTDARVTAWILLGLIGLAIGLSLVFENRAFCSNVCPIGGFTGMYSQMAPVELRVRDGQVCAEHTEKTCYQECPWGVYPLALKDSSACGLCMECLRVCPQDNIALNLRPFGSDLGVTRRSQRLDEAFLALVMLGSALALRGSVHWSVGRAEGGSLCDRLASLGGVRSWLFGAQPGGATPGVWAGSATWPAIVERVGFFAEVAGELCTGHAAAGAVRLDCLHDYLRPAEIILYFERGF